MLPLQVRHTCRFTCKNSTLIDSILTRQYLPQEVKKSVELQQRVERLQGPVQRV